MEDPIGAFKQFLRRGEVKPNSIYQYCQAIKEFLAFLGNRQLDESAVQGYLDSLTNRNLKLRTQHFKKIALRHFLQSLRRIDLFFPKNCADCESNPLLVTAVFYVAMLHLL